MSLIVRLDDQNAQLGMLEIVNDGTLSTDGNASPLGNYRYALQGTVALDSRRRFVVKGRIEDFDRALGAWELVRLALVDALDQSEGPPQGPST